MPYVLLVEDSRTEAAVLRALLEDGGLEVRVVGDGRAALRAVAARPPDVVLTALNLPELDGLQVIEAVRRDFPAVPVVLMTGAGSEDTAAQALRLGAASYVPKRNLARDILPTLQNVLNVTNADQQPGRSRAEECLAETAFRFVMPNDPELVPSVVGYLEERYARVCTAGPHGLMCVGMAVNEALLNAIYHGNLEVSSDLRQEDERVYHDEARRRMRTPPYCDRRVTVTARFSDAEAVFTVADEGPGFDPSRLPDPDDPANLERVGGRGLTLIRSFMDRVEHNPTGNRLTMHKRNTPGG